MPSSIHTLWRIRTILVCAILVSGGLFAACSSGSGDEAIPVTVVSESASATGPVVQVSLDLSAVLSSLGPEKPESTYSLVRALDLSGRVLFGPVRIGFTGTKGILALKGLPAAAKLIFIENRTAAGKHYGISIVPVDVAADQNKTLIAVAETVKPLVSSGGGDATQKVFVEIVNDSDTPDASTYVLFDTPTMTPKPVVDGIQVLEDSSHSSGQSQVLTSLTSSTTTVSRYTGELRKVFSFGVSTVDSGRFTFSFNKPIVINNGSAPTVDTGIRYDKMELTFKKDPNSGVLSGGGNLTAIDFHAIPLQVEVTHFGQTEPDPLQTKSFFASMTTLIKALEAIGGRERLAPAMRTLDGGELSAADKDSANFANFARILTPNVFADPANAIAADLKVRKKSLPYPGFAGYLNSLVGKKYVFNGQQHGGYNYTCTFGKALESTDGFSGYKANCSGTGIDAAQQIPVKTAPRVPVNADVTLKFPEDILDFIIYGSVSNETSYSIAGYPFIGAAGAPFTQDDLIATANQSAYGSLKGDVHAALNFGYFGGRYDPKSDSEPRLDISPFYASAMLPYAYPFGGARTDGKDDGYYNPWGALMNNVSDAYSHPFSDRILAASPLYNLKAGDTVRITILNDRRLDTPMPSVSFPSVSNSTDNTQQLTVSWPTVANATSYSITTVPTVASPSCTVVTPEPGKEIQGCNLTGLNPGSSYRIKVMAKGVNTQTGKPVTSGSVSVQGITAGAIPTLAAGKLSVGFNINLPDAPKIPGMTAFINGSLARTGDGAQNVFLMLAPAVQYTIPLQIKNAASQVIYSGNYFLTLNASSSADSFVITKGYLDFSLVDLAPAGPPDTPPYANAGGLVIGSGFSVKPYYKYFPVMFPN
jgi:hypothetical protein